MARTSKPIAISLDPSSLKSLDRLARREGVNRSMMVRGLVERAAAVDGVPDVRVDGRRFVPEKK